MTNKGLGLGLVAAVAFTCLAPLGLAHCESDDSPRTLSLPDASEDGKTSEGGAEGSAPVEASTEGGVADTGTTVVDTGSTVPDTGTTDTNPVDTGTAETSSSADGGTEQ